MCKPLLICLLMVPDPIFLFVYICSRVVIETSKSYGRLETMVDQKLGHVLVLKYFSITILFWADTLLSVSVNDSCLTYLF